MKTIKALEPITAYGPDKLMLFAGETAEVEDSFAQQLIDEGKAEESSGGGSGGRDFTTILVTGIVQGDMESITLTNATAIVNALDTMWRDPLSVFNYGLVFDAMAGGQEFIQSFVGAAVSGADNAIGFLGHGADGLIMCKTLEGEYYANPFGDPIQFDPSEITEDDTLVISLSSGGSDETEE